MTEGDSITDPLVWEKLQNKQYTYTGNIEERLHYKCCRGKAMSITHSEYVSLVSVIQHALRMRLLYCHLWSVWLYHTCPHYLINAGFLTEIY